MCCDVLGRGKVVCTYMRVGGGCVLCGLGRFYYSVQMCVENREGVESPAYMVGLARSMG